MIATNKHIHSASFRDPSGYVYLENGKVKRRINPIYFKQYTALKERNIFQKLFSAELLIKHKELSKSDAEIIIQPEQIPFITYPYEWSFMQYKEAALLTLKIQKFCLENDFSLKDASAFNVAFHLGKAVFIDSLSFDFYSKNEPWRAFKQFITHFLGPLTLAHYHGAQSLKLMSNFIDGIPTGMLSSMLPFKTKFNPFLYSNIHLLAKFEDKHNDNYKGSVKVSKLSKRGQINIITSLYNYIKKLEIKETSEWGDYYSNTNYSDSSFLQKSKLVDKWVASLKANTLIDVGGNDGTFVRKINHVLEQALVCDIDNIAVDINYLNIKKENSSFITPFVLDIFNPTPAIGFNNKERQSFIQRIQEFKPDITMVLAVIHHMSLSGNIPFQMSAKFFASFSKYLIIEYPKRGDSWVVRLLNTKGEFKEHFNFYNIENFEKCYSNYFDVIEKEPIKGSERMMYLLKLRNV
jgi:hypothetical protein